MRHVTIFALISTLSAAQAVILIDDFSSGSSTLVDTTPGSITASFQSGLSNFGGTRAHLLRQVTSPLNGTSTSEVNSGLFGSNTLESTSQMSLNWGTSGISSDQQSVLFADRNYDFSANQKFRVHVNSASARTRISLLLIDSASNQQARIAEDSITLFSAINTPTILTFDFTDTPSFIAPGFNFGEVDLFRLEVNSPASGGYAINRVEAVPEPATMSALLLGAGMLVRRRRAGK